MFAEFETAIAATLNASSRKLSTRSSQSAGALARFIKQALSRIREM